MKSFYCSRCTGYFYYKYDIAIVNRYIQPGVGHSGPVLVQNGVREERGFG